MRTTQNLSLLTALALAVAGCAKESAVPAMASAPDQFLDGLRAHCGKAYEGRIINPQPSDSSFAGKTLVMHVRECGDTVRVPFHVGDDHSRTWVFTRLADGVRLKHDHRHEDGSEDLITQYGGDARDGSVSEGEDALDSSGSEGENARGPVARMEFKADSLTAALIPAASTNVWTVEISPTAYVYQLVRVGTDRRFRVEFDLTREVSVPPAPWGYEDR